jgi:nucleoside-diphosphate-sugar epimerase
MKKILITGALGQIGTELSESAARILGRENVIISDVREPQQNAFVFEHLDVLDRKQWVEILEKHRPDTVFHLAALLSATGEKNPGKAWDLNVNSLLIVLELAREGKIKKIFWPSSIAVFGPTTPKHNVPQHTITEPTTVYGISKLAGERWCEWYFRNHGVDVRSIRYPGLIGWKSAPGGGTTDYAVHIFYEAIRHKHYTCFLKANTTLPMMCMEDAVRGTLELMLAPPEKITIRSSYNLSGISFSPEELYEKIREHIPDFQIEYAPDFRQQIADNWPASVSDEYAQMDWGWKPQYTLERLVSTMLSEIKKQFI